MAGLSNSDAMVARQVRETHPMERLDHKPGELFGLLSKRLAWKIQVAIIDSAMYTIIPGKKNKFSVIPDRIDRAILVMRPRFDHDTSSDHSANNKFCLPIGEVLPTDINVRASVERIVAQWTGWQLDEVVTSLPESIIAGNKVVYTYIVTVTNISSTVGIDYFQPTGSPNKTDFEWLQYVDDIKDNHDMLKDTRDLALLAFKYKTKYWDTLDNMLYKKAGEACEHSKDYEYSVRVAVLLPPEQSKGAEPSLLILKGQKTEKWQPVVGTLRDFTTEMTIYATVKQIVFNDAGLIVNKIIACVQDKPRFIQQESKTKQGAVVLEYLVGVLPTKELSDLGQTKVKHDETKFKASKWVSSLDGAQNLGVGCKDFIERALPLAGHHVKTGEVKFKHDRWAVTLPDDEQPETTRLGPSAFKSTGMEGGAKDFKSYYNAPSSIQDTSSTFHPLSSDNKDANVKGEDEDDDEDRIIIIGVDTLPVTSTPTPTHNPAEPLWSEGYMPTLAQANAVDENKALRARHFPVIGTAKHKPVQPSAPTVPRQKKLTQIERKRLFQQQKIDERADLLAISNELAAATLTQEGSSAPPAESSRSGTPSKKSKTAWFDDDLDSDDDDQKPAPVTKGKGKGKANPVDTHSDDSDDIFATKKENKKPANVGKSPAKSNKKPQVKDRGTTKYNNDDSDSEDIFPNPSKESKKPGKAKAVEEEEEDPVEKERKAMLKFTPNGYYPGENLQPQQQKDPWALAQDSDSD